MTFFFNKLQLKIYALKIQIAINEFLFQLRRKIK